MLSVKLAFVALCMLILIATMCILNLILFIHLLGCAYKLKTQYNDQFLAFNK